MKLTSRFIAVPRRSKKQKIRDFVTQQGYVCLGGSEWEELRAAFPDCTEHLLREAVQQAGAELKQPWAGVDAHTLEGLGASLTQLSRFYAEDASFRVYIRSTVIAAKDRARGASRNLRVEHSKRLTKAEMVNWLLVWLDDPAMFPAWVALRKQALAPDLKPPSSSADKTEDGADVRN